MSDKAKELIVKEGNSKTNQEILSAIQKHERDMCDIRRMRTAFEDITISFDKAQIEYRMELLETNCEK